MSDFIELFFTVRNVSTRPSDDLGLMHNFLAVLYNEIFCCCGLSLLCYKWRVRGQLADILTAAVIIYKP